MITIDIHPNLFSGDLLGSLVLSWHGFFSFVAVAVAVVLVGRWAPMKGLDPDAIYSIAIWVLIGGIIGARLVHVVDNWSIYQNDPFQILAIWGGGIGLWGAILGGFIGGAGYCILTKQPVGAVADLTAPVLPFVQSIGRIGDIINGEHCAKAADFFLGMRWINDDTAAGSCANGWLNHAQPVILYEIAWNMVSLGILWALRGRLKPNGMLFAVYLALYAVGRFAITFAREDRVWALGMQEAHYIAFLVLIVTVPLLVFRARLQPKAILEEGSDAPVHGTRAERRRRR